MNTESLKMKNTKQKARHVVTGFSLWRRTRDSLSLRFPNQPSRAAVRSASSTAAPFFPRCIVHRTRSVKTLTPRNAPLGSNLHAFQKQQPIRKRVWAVAGMSVQKRYFRQKPQTDTNSRIYESFLAKYFSKMLSSFLKLQQRFTKNLLSSG